MTTHKTLVLGGTGFIGQALVRQMSSAGLAYVSLGSKDVDLEAPGASDLVADVARNCTSAIFLSAIAPTKTISQFSRNAAITEAVCTGLQEAESIQHLTVVSSDAVYSVPECLVHEKTRPSPDSLHGVMCLSREIACEAIGIPNVLKIRSTAVFGSGDSHNSYGPNRFVRQLIGGQPISIFGRGSAIRDHIAVSDLANLILTCAANNQVGVVNGVTGRSASFLEIAEIIANLSPKKTEIAFDGSEGMVTARYYEITNSVANECVKTFPSLEERMRELVLDALEGGSTSD